MSRKHDPDMSHPGTTSTELWGQTYAVRANWAEASSQIEALDADNEWCYTGRQVADYRHCKFAALREDIEKSCLDEIDDESEAEIDGAMERAE